MKWCLRTNISLYVLQLFESPVKESLSFSFVFLCLFPCRYFNFVVLFCFCFLFLLFIELVFFLSFLQTEKKRSGMWRREVNYAVCEVNCVSALIFVEHVKLIRSSQWHTTAGSIGLYYRSVWLQQAQPVISVSGSHWVMLVCFLQKPTHAERGHSHLLAAGLRWEFTIC